ncbi:MAG: sensor histidine kinase, partial [Myxococcota bacterium]
AIDRRAFHALVGPWLAVNPAVEAVEWAPLVRAEDRDIFELSARDADVPDYRILAHRPDGSLGPAAPSDLYAPVLYVEPLSRFGPAVGYDLASQPDRRRALEEARDTGMLVATSGVRLVLFPGEWGILAVTATYGGIEPPTTLADRRAEVRGFVATVIRTEVLVQDALSRADGRGLGVRLTDLSTFPPQVLSGPAATATPAEALTWSTFHAVGGRTWRVDVFTAGPAPHTWAGWGVLAAGLASTALVVAFVIDARARTERVEQLVGDRTAALEHANAALARSNLELQRFAYVASHDMREPLRTVRSFSELLAREHGGQLGPGGSRYLERVVTATCRMQALVTELLEFARLDSRVEPFTSVPLAEPATAALDDLAAVLQESGAEVTVGDLPTARCDRVQMVQLFQNLVSNAVKFRRPDVPPRIVITARTTSEGCEVSVADNGIGIEKRHWDRVFDIYQRLHPDAAYPGRGIGLATCRRIVERHGGRMWVESVPGHGSVFRFTLQSAEGT